MNTRENEFPSTRSAAVETQTPAGASTLRQKTLPALLALGLSLAAITPVTGAVISETFSSFPLNTCYGEGAAVGKWRSVFDGYGCNSTVLLNGNAVLRECPAAPTAPQETHSGLMVSPSVSGNFTLQVAVSTARQLRTGSAPNDWETAWVLWNHADNTHFYYFIPKPNGWELGKADPAYPGGQRFLASGSAPAFPLGVWHQVKIVQSGQTMKVSVNGTLVTTYTDRERPYSSGRIGLYAEDAEAYFDNVTVTPATSNGKR